MREKNNPQKLRSGIIDNGVGWRCVVLSYDKPSNIVSIRPMISQVSRAPIYGWCSSIQKLVRGDYVIVSSWQENRYEVRGYQYQRNDNFVELHNVVFLNKLMSLLPDSIKAFLKRVDNGPSYLPSGYWRKKYDMTTLAKPEVIEKFLSQYIQDKEWLDYIVEQAALSPDSHLQVNWRNAKALPKAMTNHTEHWLDPLEENPKYDVLNSMIWVLIHDDGTSKLLDIPATSGHEYHGQSKKIVQTFKGLPVGIGKTVKRAIQINLGAYEKDNKSYGCRWQLFKA